MRALTSLPLPPPERTATIEGWSVRTAADLDPSATARVALEALPSLLPANGQDALASRGKVLRWRPHRAALLVDLGAPIGSVHAKVYAPKDVMEQAVELVTRSRSLTSWRMARALRAAGIATPEPRALLLRKPLRVHRGSLLLSAPLVDPVLLTHELKTRIASGAPMRDLLDGAARLAAAMHGAGFFHGDFTASNLVLGGPSDARALSLIDLDRAKDLRILPVALRRRVQALDLRLLLLTTWGEVSRRDWLRLLARYLRTSGIRGRAGRVMAARVLSARRGAVRLGAGAPTIGGRDPWAA